MNFFTPEIIVANPIPDGTSIYYSKDDAFIKVVASLGMLCFGAYFIVVGSWIAGVPLTLAGACYLVLKTRILLTSKPQIIISKSGVQTAKAPFYTWANIKDITITGEWEGRGARPSFTYQYPQGEVSIRIDRLNITPHNLNILIKFYQQPWEFKEYK